MRVEKINGFKVLSFQDKYGMVYVIFKSIIPVLRCYGYGDVLDYCFN